MMGMQSGPLGKRFSLNHAIRGGLCAAAGRPRVDRVLTRTLLDLADLSAKGMPPGMVALDALTTVCDGTRTRDLERDTPVLALAG
jgi:hypothetical protein